MRPATGIAGITRRKPLGDIARGRALLLQRQESGCILCHVLPGLPPGGALGPPLHGLASRYNSSELFQRIADARRVNPGIEILELSATNGQGMGAWLDWLLANDHHTTDALHARITQLEAELARAKAQITLQSLGQTSPDPFAATANP